MTSAPLEEIRAAKRAHEARWLALDDVVAVGIGRLAAGGDGLVVSVRAHTDEVRERVPDSVGGVPVEVRVVGDVRAL